MELRDNEGGFYVISCLLSSKLTSSSTRGKDKESNVRQGAGETTKIFNFNFCLIMFVEICVLISFEMGGGGGKILLG